MGTRAEKRANEAQSRASLPMTSKISPRTGGGGGGEADTKLISYTRVFVLTYDI